MSTIPVVGSGPLALRATRTAAVRLLLAVAVGILVLAIAHVARRPHSTLQPILPAQSGGVLVLDLSASITSDTYARILETLQQLVGHGGHYGLVVFSNVAYEALPIGTPASALAPLIRYFVVPKAAPGEQPQFPVNPWTATFTSGTEISAGLDLARRMELAAHPAHPAVLLVSDLADDPQDLDRLTSVVNEYQQNGIKLRAIALNADPTDLQRFRGLVGTASAIVQAPTPAGKPKVPVAHTAFPTWLVGLALAVAVLLAAIELRAARLDWGHAEAAPSPVPGGAAGAGTTAREPAVLEGVR